MSVHSFLPKKIELILSNASNAGSIGLDDISDVCKFIGEYHKTADSSGRKVVSYVLWRILLCYQKRYDGDPMTAEESGKLVEALSLRGKILNYLQGGIELESAEIITITESIIELNK